MFYPSQATVPESLQTDEYLIRPLRTTDVELDYEAVISSRAELWLRSGGSWLREGFTLQENLADLTRHEQEHLDRVAFTYTVMNPNETACLGCIYINPLKQMLQRVGGTPEQVAASGDYEAWTTFWVRQSHLASQLDARLLLTLLTWFRQDFAFRRVTFAARREQQRQIELLRSAQLHLLFELPRSLVFTP